MVMPAWTVTGAGPDEGGCRGTVAAMYVSRPRGECMRGRTCVPYVQANIVLCLSRVKFLCYDLSRVLDC